MSQQPHWLELGCGEQFSFQLLKVTSQICDVTDSKVGEALAHIPSWRPFLVVVFKLCVILCVLVIFDYNNHEVLSLGNYWNW